MRAGALFLVLVVAGGARAQPSTELGYHLHLVGLEPSMAAVDVWQSDVAGDALGAHPALGAGPYAGYVVLDPHSTEALHRLCVLPASWLLDGPLLGALGPRMVRGASVVSGDHVEGAAAVASLLRVFDAPDVACTDALPPLPVMTDELREREIAGVEDTLRLTANGTALEVAVVETIYRREGGSGLGVPGVAGARGPIPPSGCGCRATRAEAPLPMLLVLALALVWRRQR